MSVEAATDIQYDTASQGVPPGIVWEPLVVVRERDSSSVAAADLVLDMEGESKCSSDSMTCCSNCSCHPSGMQDGSPPRAIPHLAEAIAFAETMVVRPASPGRVANGNAVKVKSTCEVKVQSHRK